MCLQTASTDVQLPVYSLWSTGTARQTFDAEERLSKAPEFKAAATQGAGGMLHARPRGDFISPVLRYSYIGPAPVLY